MRPADIAALLLGAALTVGCFSAAPLGPRLPTLVAEGDWGTEGAGLSVGRTYWLLAETGGCFYIRGRAPILLDERGGFRGYGEFIWGRFPMPHHLGEMSGAVVGDEMSFTFKVTLPVYETEMTVDKALTYTFRRGQHGWHPPLSPYC